MNTHATITRFKKSIKMQIITFEGGSRKGGFKYPTITFRSSVSENLTDEQVKRTALRELRAIVALDCVVEIKNR